MFLFIAFLWCMTVLSVFYLFNIIFRTVRFNIKSMIILLITIVGWAYWFIPGDLKLGDISKTTIHVIADNNNYRKLEGENKELMYEIMSETDLIKIYSRAQLESLGNKEDIVILVDSEDETFHIYLVEELDNYSYMHYRKRYYKFSNEKEYYPLVNNVLDYNK